MADAMVTARMSAEKKTAGNKILQSMGANPSKIINELYDYLIEHKESPFEAGGDERKAVSAERWREACDWLDGLKVKPAPDFRNMTIKDARAHRLSAFSATDGVAR